MLINYNTGKYKLTHKRKESNSKCSNTLIVAHKQPIILLQKLEDKNIKETLSTIILIVYYILMCTCVHCNSNSIKHKDKKNQKHAL